MWHQRASYEQSNVFDVTIQCQFNVASKNIAEFSTMYGAPHMYPASTHQTSDSPVSSAACVQKGMDYDSVGYYSAQRCTPPRGDKFSGDMDYSTSYLSAFQNASPYGCTSAFEAVNQRNSSPESGQSQQTTPVSSHVSSVEPGYYTQCMNDSGYSSPVTSFRHQRNNSAFSPPTLDTVKSQCNYVNNGSQFSDPYSQALSSQQDEEQRLEDPCEEMKIAMRERDVSQRLFVLRSQDSELATDIEQYHQSQTAMIDIERHNIICQMAYDKKSSDSINRYYNRKLLSVLESVEQKLAVLEGSDDKCKKSSRHQTSQLPKKSRLLPKHAVKILESWYQENLENPYPSREVTLSMASDGGITVEQIRKWFANKRNRSRNNKLKTGLLDNGGC